MLTIDEKQVVVALITLRHINGEVQFTFCHQAIESYLDTNIVSLIATSPYL